MESWSHRALSWGGWWGESHVDRSVGKRYLSLPCIWLKTLFLECCFNIATIQLGVNFWCLGFHHSGLPAMSLQRPNPSKVQLYKRHSPYMLWIKWTHKKHDRAHNTHNNSHCFYYLTPSHINNKIQSGLYLMCFFFFSSESEWETLRSQNVLLTEWQFQNVKPLPGFRTTRAHM